MGDTENGILTMAELLALLRAKEAAGEDMGREIMIAVSGGEFFIASMTTDWDDAEVTLFGRPRGQRPGVVLWTQNDPVDGGGAGFEYPLAAVP